MDLDELLVAFDRAHVNVERLRTVWERARQFIPDGPARGSNPEYDDHRRVWNDFINALPAIDEFRIAAELPDIDAVGQNFLDYAEIGELPESVWEEIAAPERELSEYAYRLGKARRGAVRSRLQSVSSRVTELLAGIIHYIEQTDPDPSQRLETPHTEQVESAVAEVERLIGNTVDRRGRWNDLHRHMRFGQPHDWHDIASVDWPSVLLDVEAASFTELDPLPADIPDLGHAATSDITGTATTALNWSTLDDEGFERMLHDLLEVIPEHHNVKLLMNTNAPDRGRDLSFERALTTPTGDLKTERVMVQAKHWQRKSVPLEELPRLVAQAQTWPRPFHTVLVVTSGRFTADAVTWADARTEKGERPDVELWSDLDLERLLSRHPAIAAAHGLR